jgi:hypothetical protein
MIFCKYVGLNFAEQQSQVAQCGGADDLSKTSSVVAVQ